LTIKINSKPFGEIDVPEESIIEFKDGLFGFEDVKKFIVLDEKEPESPFKWLQAVDVPSLAFVIIRPIDFLREYTLSISDSELIAIDAKSPENLLVFAIVTIPGDPSLMTANLQGPIIINSESMKGRQAISMNDKYHVRHSILEEMKKAEAEE